MSLLMHSMRMWDHPHSLHVAETHGKFGRKENEQCSTSLLYFETAQIPSWAAV
jgi:hypothetical protein